MAQLLKYLLHKHEDLYLDPRLDRVTRSCSPSFAWGQPASLANRRAVDSVGDPVSRRKM